MYKDVSHMVTEAATREGPKSFLEPKQFSVFDFQIQDYGLFVGEAPEPSKDVEPPGGLMPEQFKDFYTKPNSFNEAWNHPDPF